MCSTVLRSRTPMSCACTIASSAWRGHFDPNLGDGDVADRNLQQLVKRMQYEERYLSRFNEQAHNRSWLCHWSTNYTGLSTIWLRHRGLTAVGDLGVDCAVVNGWGVGTHWQGISGVALAVATVSRPAFMVLWSVEVLQQTTAQLQARRSRNRCLSWFRFST